MKVIIDIPKHVKDDFENANIADVDCYVNDYDLLIENSTLFPDNATNGDVIKALFPNIEPIEAPLTKIYVYVYTKDHKCMRFDSDWWNAPYKEQNNEID